MLDLRRLRVLQAVARSGSFSAAARALDYTQPGVVHHVRCLETEVGTPLVLRHARGVSLTPAGELLARRADALLAAALATHEEIAALAGLHRGRVRLVAFPSANGTLVPPALARLRHQHPGLEATLNEAEPPESLDMIYAGDADIALSFAYPGLEQDDDPALRTIALSDDPQLLVLPNDHPLRRATRVDLRKLTDATWIAGCPRCRGQLVHLCAQAGFSPRITLETDDVLAVQGMIAAGLGIALLPQLSLSIVRRDDVTVRPLLNAPSRTITASTLAGAETIPAVAALLDALRHESVHPRRHPNAIASNSARPQ